MNTRFFVTFVCLISLFGPIAQASEADAQSLVVQGNTLRETGDLNGAIELYSKAIEADAKNEAAYYKRSGTYMNLKQFDRAIEDLSILIKLRPDVMSNYALRGRAYMKIGDHRRGIADLDKFNKHVLATSK